MHGVLQLLPVVLPILFWAWYHYHKDRHLPEPPGHLVIAFGLGIAAAGVSKAMYMGLEPLGLRYDAFGLAESNTLGLFAYTMLAIGPIEELAKLLPFVLVIVHFEEFDEPIDGIIYASFIALGYAAVENVMYLDFLTPVESAARGFAGPVVHILFSSVWGFTIGCAYLRGDSLFLGTLKGLALAAGLHGIYDFIVLQNVWNALPIAAIIMIAIWVWRLRLMKTLHEEAQRIAPRIDPEDG